jgi:hypothetical protein
LPAARCGASAGDAIRERSATACAVAIRSCSKIVLAVSCPEGLAVPAPQPDTTILLVTRNLERSLHAGTRLIVLARDTRAPGAGSRIVIDQAITHGAPIDSPESRELLAHVRHAGFATQ